MSIEFMLGLQIFADIALCLAIVFLIRTASREIKKRPQGISAKTFSEFSKLIEDSRRSTDDLFHALIIRGCILLTRSFEKTAAFVKDNLFYNHWAL